MPNWLVGRVGLRRTVDRLKFKQATCGACKTERLRSRANDGRQKIMRGRMPMRQFVDLRRLAEPGDSLDTTGVQTDHVDSSGIDNFFDARSVPFPFAVCDPDLSIGPAQLCIPPLGRLLPCNQRLCQIRRPVSPRSKRRIPEVESATAPRNPKVLGCVDDHRAADAANRTIRAYGMVTELTVGN